MSRLFDIPAVRLFDPGLASRLGFAPYREGVVTGKQGKFRARSAYKGRIVI